MLRVIVLISSLMTSVLTQKLTTATTESSHRFKWQTSRCFKLEPLITSLRLVTKCHFQRYPSASLHRLDVSVPASKFHLPLLPRHWTLILAMPHPVLSSKLPSGLSSSPVCPSLSLNTACKSSFLQSVPKVQPFQQSPQPLCKYEPLVDIKNQPCLISENRV